MPNCKGIAVTSRLHFIQERFGQRQYEALVAALPEKDRALIEARILPHAWVPMDTFLHLCVEADKMFGKGDLALCLELGSYSAEVNLPRIFKLFYRLGSPAFIFTNAAKLWAAHYDTGWLKVYRDDTGLTHLEIHDFATPHRAHCLGVLGWAKKSIELSGETVKRYEEARCRTRGDALCELLLQW